MQPNAVLPFQPSFLYSINPLSRIEIKLPLTPIAPAEGGSSLLGRCHGQSFLGGQLPVIDGGAAWGGATVVR